MSDASGPGHRLVVYAIPEAKDGERPFWPRIGAAFTNRDGSITLLLDALPLGTNRLQVREPKPVPEGRAAAGGRRDLETIEVRS